MKKRSLKIRRRNFKSGIPSLIESSLSGSELSIELVIPDCNLSKKERGETIKITPKLQLNKSNVVYDC